jgi:hypothetical protein
VFAVTLLVASMLGSLSSSALASQEPSLGPTVPPTEEPTVPPTEEPTVPPTEEPTVPPMEEPTVPPTEEPTVPPTEDSGDSDGERPGDVTDEPEPQDALGDPRIIVVAKDCSGVIADESVFGATSFDVLQNLCPHRPLMPFSLSVDALPAPDQVTNNEGSIEWTDIAVEGNQSVTIHAPSYYARPRVACNENGSGLMELGPLAVIDLGGADYQINLSTMKEELDGCVFILMPADVEEPPVEETGHVVIHKYDCSGVFSAAELGQQDVDALLANCPVMPGVDFALGNFCENPCIPIKPTDAQGTVEWTEFPAQNVTMQETLPSGFGTPVAFCRQATGLGVIYSPQEVVHSEGGLPYISVPLDPGGFVECDWFNARLAGDVQVEKFDCSGVLDADFAYDLPLNELLGASCVRMPGIEFTINGSQSQVTGANGIVSWEGIESGQVDISEMNVPEGFGTPIVWCNFAPQTVTLGTVTVDLDAEVGIGCSWWNIPRDDVREGTVHLTKRLCPPEVAFGEPNRAELLDVCTSQGGIEFTIEPANPGQPPQLVTPNPGVTDLNGEILWDDNVPAGEVTLTEQVLDGYGTPIVFCDSTAGPIGFVEVSELSVTQVVPPVGTLTCEWFNVYDPILTSVVVLKQDCPAGITAADLGTVQDLTTNCVDPVGGVQFAIDPLVQPDGPGAVETGVDGYAIWSGIWTSQDVLISENVPQGYLDPVVFCSAGDPHIHGDFTLMEVGQSASVQVPVTTPGVFCIYANIQDAANVPEPETGRVQIDKFDCGGTISYEDAVTAELAVLQASCVSAMVGVEFTLDPDVAPNPRLTDANGQAIWGPVAAGPVTVTETIPQGYGQPVVLCEAGDGTFVNYQVTDGAISHELMAHTILVCKWFNIAQTSGEENPETGQLFVTKYACPTDYDADQATLAELQADCGNSLMQGVRFTVGPAAAPAPVQFTNEGGEVYWYDIPAGQITVTETIPAGYGEPVVYCEVNHIGQYSREEVAIGSINRPLGAGETVVCEWFNTSAGDLPGNEPGDLPSDEPGGYHGDPGDDPIVTTFPNTGSGPAAADSGTESIVISLALLGVVALTSLVACSLVWGRLRR